MNYKALTKVFISTLFIFIFFIISKAQTGYDWSVKFSKYVDWYSLNPSGILIVSTSDGLYGLDPAKKSIIWELDEFKGVPWEKVSVYNNTPYIAINDFDPGEGKFKIKNPLKPFKNIINSSIDRFILIDPLSSDIVFDSKSDSLGFTSITKKNYVRDINCILLQGMQEKNRSFGLYDLNNRKMRWLLEKPVKLKTVTLNDDLDYYIDPNGDLLFRYVGATYLLDGNNGNLLWKRPNDSLYTFQFSSSGTTYCSGGNFIAELNMQNGEIVDKISPPDFQPKDTSHENFLKSLFFSGIKLIPLKDELMATYQGGFNLFDKNNLKPKWEKAFKIADASVVSVMPVNDDKLLIFLKDISKKQTSITLVEKETKKSWDLPYSVKGSQIKLIELTEKGIICVTDEQADFVSLSNGVSILNSTIKFDTGQYVITAHAKDKHRIAFYNSGRVYEMNYDTHISKVVIEKIDFKGQDLQDKLPNLLEAREGGYFIAALQNAMFIDYDGSVRYNNYYKKPGLSDKTKKLLAFGGGLALGYIFNDEAQKLTNEMYNSGLLSKNDYLITKAYDYRSGTGSAFVAGGLSSIAFQQLNERQKNNQTYKSYQLFLTKLENGEIGFYKIEKNSGETISSITLQDKDPSIKIDGVIDAMYYFDNKEIFFYKLK